MLRWVPKNTNLDFVGKRYLAFALSAFILLGSLFLLFSKGLNFGIDFTGGTLIEIQVTQEAPDLTELRNELNTLELGNISIQEFGAPNDLLIRLPQQGEDPFAQQEAIESVKEKLDGIFEEGLDYSLD